MQVDLPKRYVGTEPTNPRILICGIPALDGSVPSPENWEQQSSFGGANPDHDKKRSCQKAQLLPKALAKLDSVRNLGDLRHLFELEGREKYFFNFRQVVLAYAFYLAKIGDEVEAQRYMSEWLKTFEPQGRDPKDAGAAIRRSCGVSSDSSVNF